MKTSEEFMNSVWAKSDKAAAKEKLRKKRITKYVTGLAACLMLGMGIFGTVSGLTDKLWDGSSKSASPEMVLTAPGSSSEAPPEVSDNNEIYMSGSSNTVTSDQDKGSVSDKSFALATQIEVENIKKGISTCYTETEDMAEIMSWFEALQGDGKIVNEEENRDDAKGAAPEGATYKLKFDTGKVCYVIGEVESFE